MEHGNRWRLFLESNSNAACWICEKWNYTLFFWTPEFGRTDEIKINSEQLQDYEERKYCFDYFQPQPRETATKKNRPDSGNRNAARNVTSPSSGGAREERKGQMNSGLVPINLGRMAKGDNQFQYDCPLFTGSFSSYEEPARMIRVKEFAHLVDRKKPEFFAWLKERKLISKESQKYQELSERDKKVYQEHKQSWINKYEPEKWKTTIAKCL